MSSQSANRPTVRPANPEDAKHCLDIYAPIVHESPTSFEAVLPSVDEFARRIQETLADYPWLVAEADGELAGYAYGRRHRERIAYQWSVEVSVYISVLRRRRGVGRALYGELIEILTRQGFYNAYAIIALPNPISVAFHESMGFTAAGLYPKAGYKLGRWHDVGWWSLRLRDSDAPPSPPIPYSRIVR